MVAGQAHESRKNGDDAVFSRTSRVATKFVREALGAKTVISATNSGARSTSTFRRITRATNGRNNFFVKAPFNKGKHAIKGNYRLFAQNGI
jgi:hypothetical protein